MRFKSLINESFYNTSDEEMIDRLNSSPSWENADTEEAGDLLDDLGEDTATDDGYGGDAA